MWRPAITSVIEYASNEGRLMMPETSESISSSLRIMQQQKQCNISFTRFSVRLGERKKRREMMPKTNSIPLTMRSVKMEALKERTEDDTFR